MQKITFFSFLILLLASCSSDKKQALVHFSKARELWKKDDIKNASQEIENAITLYSTNLDFQRLKANIIREAGNYDQAIGILEGLLDKKFKLDTVNCLLGECYVSYGYSLELKGDNSKSAEYYEKSIKYFDSAININVNYYYAYEGKSLALNNLNRYEDALIVTNNASIIFPDSSMVLASSKGHLKGKLGDLSGAMNDLNTSIQSGKLNPHDLANAYRSRGNLFHEHKKDYDKAISDFTNAINLCSDYSALYIDRGEAYLKKGMKDKACEDFRKAADLGSVTEYLTFR